MKLISVVTPCYNEAANVHEVYQRVKTIFSRLTQYQYEHLFIDNASTDNTIEILRKIAIADPNVKVIINTKNFGTIRSPYHAVLQAKGDAIINLVADLQDPPELIPELIQHWEQGSPIVAAVKLSTSESFWISRIRRWGYRCLSKLSEVKLVNDFYGFGLFDRKIIEILRNLDICHPYFRGLIAETGYPIVEVPYHQPTRHQGKTKNNFFTLLEVAMLGMTSHTKVPLRFATLLGGILSGGCLFLSCLLPILKLSGIAFSLAQAYLILGFFFLGAVQLFFLGILGEYVLSAHTQILKRPLVIERERINC